MALRRYRERNEMLGKIDRAVHMDQKQERMTWLCVGNMWGRTFLRPGEVDRTWDPWDPHCTNVGRSEGTARCLSQRRVRRVVSEGFHLSRMGTPQLDDLHRPDGLAQSAEVLGTIMEGAARDERDHESNRTERGIERETEVEWRQ